MTSRLDLLLINPGSRTEIYQELGAELAAIEPPLWAGMIATFVRNRGFSVKILDAEAEELEIDWATIESADGTDRSGTAWGNLLHLVARVAPK
jgi:hypothetical protein